jgi:hypothetical protein
MNVLVSDPSIQASALRHRFLLQEDSINASRRPEVIIHDGYFEGVIPPEILTGFYGKLSSSRPDHFYSRFWTGKEWHPQTIVGIPAWGFMNEGLGEELVTASSLRVAPKAPNGIFDYKYTEDMLRQTKDLDGNPFRGFVSFLFHGKNLVSAQRSIPWYGTFAAFEMFTCRLSQFLSAPLSTKLMSRNYVASLLTVSPFPQSRTAKDGQILVSGLVDKIQRHFWPFVPSQILKQSFYTKHTMLGVATAWSDEIVNAADRASWTLREIAVSSKQFRTDLASIFRALWSVVQFAGA